MAIVTLEDLIEAGVHFGHRVSRWNPKMEPFIFGKRNTIHIIDLRETIKGLIRAYRFLEKLSATGEDVLFVGTKRQAREVVQQQAQAAGMHYVTERWLGGTLTNYRTIRSRLARLEEIESMEQDGSIERYSKKMISSISRQKRKLLRNLQGIRNMTKLPGALVIIDPRREHIALKEANRVGIPTICLIDTDSDPDLVDIPIPSNDDAFRSIRVILSRLVEAIGKGREQRTQLGITDAVAAPAGAAGAVAAKAEAEKTDEAKPDEAKPDEAKPDGAKAEETKTEASKTEETKAEATPAAEETPKAEAAGAESKGA